MQAERGQGKYRQEEVNEAGAGDKGGDGMRRRRRGKTWVQQGG